MKTKITLLFALLLINNLLMAQFAADHIQFWVGEGDRDCYLALDFRDGTSDPSFAFGFRFNESDGLNMADMLAAIAAEEPFLSSEMSGMFLEDIVYNSHSGVSGEPDWWSTWSGSGLETLEMNSGMAESLSNQQWYGLSYGFMPQPMMPTVTYPAYSSQWFTGEEIDYSLGEGANSAIVVVDFVTSDGAEPESLAWKVNFENSISHIEALQLIAANNANFEVEFDEGQVSFIKYKELQGSEWLAYEGTNLSNWKLAETNLLINGSWLGYVKGATYTRRPFTPHPAEAAPILTAESFLEGNFVLYPNPTKNKLSILASVPVSVKVFDLSGRSVVILGKTNNPIIDLSSLQQGVYLVQLAVEGKTQIKKIVKQ